MGAKLLNEIKSMYANISACVRVKGGESDRFKIDSGVRKECIMSPWLWYNCGIHTYMGLGDSGFNCWRGQGVKGSALVLFLFYVNVSGLRPRSRLSSQPLTILAPWVLLRVGRSIPLIPLWVSASHFLVGNREAEL